MKNIKKILAVALSTLLIASCGSSKSDDTNSNEQGSDITTNTNTTPTNYGNFPFKQLNDYVSEYGVTIPGLVSDAEWHFTTDVDEYGPYALAMTDDDDTTLAVEHAYLEVISKDENWVNLNEDYEQYGYIFDDITESVEVQFFTMDGTFYLYAFPIDEGYDSDVNGFDFATEGQITSKGDSETIWTYEDVTMKVTKGSSSVNVGNGSFYSDPLRLYSGQVVTFTWGSTTPTCFAVKVDMSIDNTKSTVAAGSDTSTGFSIKNGTVRVEGEMIYYTPTGSAKSLTVTIGTKQCHWAYVEIE